MFIRLTYLASAFSLAAAASKSAKTSETPTPSDAAKAGKSNASKSSKCTTGGEYFIAPFSCPKTCISAQDYVLSNHLLDDAVSECDAGDDYQKWKVHQSGGFLKFESAAQYDEGMCLAVVHQDSDHSSNKVDSQALERYPCWGFVVVLDWLRGNDLEGVIPPELNSFSADDVDEMCTGDNWDWLIVTIQEATGITPEGSTSRPYAGIRVSQLP
eukprot:scaffold7534_cov87-Skeletonema_menzelii.AAC.2